MIPPVAVAITLLVLVAALLGMAISWRLRGRRQAGLAVPQAPGAEGRVLTEADGLYLATTFAGRPLERVSAAGLGFRARAHLTVTDTGVRIDRDGSDALTVPAASIRGAGTATWTLDRAVEPGGLAVLAWFLDSAAGPVPVESSFRLEPRPRDAFVAAVAALVPAP
ncbi:MAG: PH-like domain-containing protein [Amnibacterium sp.]